MSSISASKKKKKHTTKNHVDETVCFTNSHPLMDIKIKTKY